MRLFAMAYSLTCYALAVTVLVALILFIKGLILPITINQPSPLSPQLPVLPAIFANVALIAFWGLQHSVMADTRFKARKPRRSMVAG